MKISSKSKARIRRLFTPPTLKTGFDRIAPKNLTVKALIHHKRFKKLRLQTAFVVIEDGRVLCVANLLKLGWDFCHKQVTMNTAPSP